jgi:long-chain fatty acid transport protein
MRKTYLTRSILVASLISSQSFAAGFQINAQSATGLGRAFAGDAVIADNASVMARNPAAMALFDSTSMSLGIEQVTSFIEVKNATYTTPLDTSDIDDTDDIGGTSYVPNFHLIVPVNDQFAWGVNAYSNFGTETDFPEDYLAAPYAGNTKIASYNLGVAGSYRINEQWSVGAGLDFIYGQGTFQRGAVAQGPETTLMNIDGADGWAVGFNLGTVYELDENNRFGLAYHYSPDFTAEDDHGQEVSFSLPDMLEFSGYHKLKDSKWAVHYSIEYISWSEFDTVEFSNIKLGGQTGVDISSEYAWQNGWHYAIGTTYYLNSDWTLRAGYMYDTSAQDEITSISVPDSDRHWFSFGTTYHINTQSNVDFGFTYLMSEDVQASEYTYQEDGLGSVTGTTRADAILIGLQYSRTF